MSTPPAVSDLGKLRAESAFDALPDPGDAGDRLAEDARDELARLADDLVALGREPRMRDEQLAARPRRPVEGAVEPAGGRRDGVLELRTARQLVRTSLEPLGLALPFLGVVL